MASILDAGLVSVFSGIFVFLLVYALVWGGMSRLKWFGDKSPGPNALIAFAVAMLMAVAPPARNFVMFLAPWYIALAIVVFFVLFTVSLFGLNAEKDFPKIIKEPKVYIWIVIMAIIIFIGGIAFTFGQSAYEAGQGVQVSNPENAELLGQNPTVGSGQYAPGQIGPPAGQPGSTATPSFQQNFINTLIHPKVLGLMVTMFIASVAIYFLSSG